MEKPVGRFAADLLESLQLAFRALCARHHSGLQSGTDSI